MKNKNELSDEMLEKVTGGTDTEQDETEQDKKLTPENTSCAYYRY